MIKTLITLKKDILLTGKEPIAAVAELNEMETLELQTPVEDQAEEFENYTQYVYNGGVPLAFIGAFERLVEGVTIWADREDVEDSVKYAGWTDKLKKLESRSKRLVLVDGKESGFNAKICMTNSSHSEYFSISQIESLLRYENRVALVSGERNVKRIEKLGAKFEENDPLMAQRIKKCALQRIVETGDFNIFRIEGEVRYDPEFESSSQGGSGSKIVVFDKKISTFTIVAESDLNFDLKTRGEKNKMISIATSNHCTICVKPNSRAYKQFSQFCEFSPMIKTNSVEKIKKPHQLSF